MFTQAQRGWILTSVFILMAALLAAMTVMAKPAQAAHPGTNGRVAFTSDRDGDNEIYAMNLDGSNVVKVTNNTYNDRMPSFGPGGEAIAFVSNRDGNHEIYLSDENGANVSRLTNDAALDEQPTWSNNGMEIAFVRTVTGEDSEIFTLNSDNPEGSTDELGETVAPEQLTDNSMDDERPSYGPSGQLAFDREAIGVSGQDQIVVMADTATGDEVVLAADGTGNEWDADWSPDGTKLLYVKGQGSDPDVRSMNPDGTNRVNVAAGANPEQRPAYTPDGTAVVYHRQNSGNNEVYKKVLSSGTVTNLTSNSANDTFPEVRPINETRTIQTSVETTLEDAEFPNSHTAVIAFDERESYEPATSYECRLNGDAWSSCTSPVTYNALPLGVEHTFEVRGTSDGVTESPVSTTWKVETEEAPESLGLIVPSFFYALELENIFGHVFGPEYAGLGDEPHAGSVAYEAGFVGAGNRGTGYLENGSQTRDAIVKACKNKIGNFKIISAALNNKTGVWHYAAAKGAFSCNRTYTSSNHIKHRTKHSWENNYGLTSWHRG